MKTTHEIQQQKQQHSKYDTVDRESVRLNSQAKIVGKWTQVVCVCVFEREGKGKKTPDAEQKTEI